MASQDTPRERLDRFIAAAEEARARADISSGTVRETFLAIAESWRTLAEELRRLHKL